MRKTREVKAEVERASSKLKEIEALLKEAESEEASGVEAINNQINEICRVNNFFCGVILSAEDISKIVQLAIESKEQIRIPFNLYFND